MYGGAVRPVQGDRGRRGLVAIAHSTELKRVSKAEELLPVMVRVARRSWKDRTEVRVAVLTAWAALEGLAAWTPEMVVRVNREMGAQK